MQLAGYLMLAEVAYGAPQPSRPVPDSRQRCIRSRDTQELWAAVVRAVAAIRRMGETQWCPPATPVRKRCVECEYDNCGHMVNSSRITVPERN
jgi:CRISPR/Cas system-associated exonuclease Cas4 (RecB family)